MSGVPIRLLGQSGVRFEFDGVVVYIDPYLTDYVYDVERVEDLRRQVEIPMPPREIVDADYVLVTHVHMDHCDPTTIRPLLDASPQAKLICPNECRAILTEAGVSNDRLRIAAPNQPVHDRGIQFHTIPAAHTEVEEDEDGFLKYVGYMIEFQGRRFYHAGDTSPDLKVINAVQALGPVDVAMLPVNERNFYRDQRGIVGNMSVREAFQLALDVSAKHLVPLHWDMFAPNSVYPEEIELLYRLMKPPFQLHMSVDML